MSLSTFYRGSLATPLFFIPLRAEACAVCYSSITKGRSAYYLTTILLGLLPLLILFGLYWLLKRGASRHDGNHIAP